jgi:hypothetical protein
MVIVFEKTLDYKDSIVTKPKRINTRDMTKTIDANSLCAYQL